MKATAIEFPSENEILMTREFEAPIELVFEVFTKEEHVRNTFPPSTPNETDGVTTITLQGA